LIFNFHINTPITLTYFIC